MGQSSLGVLLVRFLSYGVPLVAVQLFLILQFFAGTEFPVMRMEKLPIRFLLHQIGQLKSSLLIKAKQKQRRIFCTVYSTEPKWVG